MKTSSAILGFNQYGTNIFRVQPAIIKPKPALRLVKLRHEFRPAVAKVHASNLPSVLWQYVSDRVNNTTYLFHHNLQVSEVFHGGNTFTTWHIDKKKTHESTLEN